LNSAQTFESRRYIEQQVLGSVFLDETLAPQIIGVIKPEMLSLPQHRNLLKMVDRLLQAKELISPESIVSKFGAHLDSIGGVSYLMELVTCVVSVSNLDYNLKQIIEYHARQKLVQLLEETKQTISDPSAGAFEEILDSFEQKALEIRPKTNRENRNVDNLTSWFEDIVLRVQDPSRAFGILTGWDQLDRMTLGFQRSNLIVVGARTSMGKSAFANEIKMRAAGRGHKVADFSLEMSTAQIYSRMAANLSKIPLQSLRTGQLNEGQVAAIARSMDDLRKIHIDDSRGVTAEYITSEMRRLKRQQGLDLVIIDYLQEIVEPNEQNDNGGSAMHRVCQKLRKAAQECDCAVIGLSQVKQDVDSRANKRPFVSDLYGGAAISAVADDIILLYRDDYYNPDSDDRGKLEVNLAKQRNGPTGVVKLLYDKDYQRITSLTGRPVAV